MEEADLVVGVGEEQEKEKEKMLQERGRTKTRPRRGTIIGKGGTIKRWLALWEALVLQLDFILTGKPPHSENASMWPHTPKFSYYAVTKQILYD